MAQDPYDSFSTLVSPAPQVAPAPARQAAARPVAPTTVTPSPAPSPSTVVPQGGLPIDDRVSALMAQGYSLSDIEREGLLSEPGVEDEYAGISTPVEAEAVPPSDLAVPYGGAPKPVSVGTDTRYDGVDVGPADGAFVQQYDRNNDNRLSEDEMMQAGYKFDQATGSYWKGTPPTPGYLSAREQEQATLDERGDLGVRRYDEPDFLDQGTAPINDEVGWLAAFAPQLAMNLGRTAIGRENKISAVDRANAVRDLHLEGQERFERDHPAQAIGGGLLGGAVFAPARGAAVPGLLGRLGTGGAISGAYGVADGDSLANRAVNGLLSAGLGMATQGVFEAAPALAKASSRAFTRATNPGSFPTRQEAKVGAALENAIVRDEGTAAGLLDALPSRPAGQIPAEAGGENLLGLAEIAAQAPGKARSSLLGALSERQDGASGRISREIAETFGAEGNVFANLKSQVAARRETSQAAMSEIENDLVPLSDAALRAVRTNLSSRAVRQEVDNALANLDDETGLAAQRLLGLTNDLMGPVNARLSVRESQDISYALKEAASQAYRNGSGTTGERLQKLSNAIRDNARTNADNTLTPYGEWLKRYGDDSEAIDALRVGNNVFATATEKNAMSAAELRGRWEKWSETARDNYKLGVGEAIMNKVRGGQDVAAMRRLLRDEELGDRARIAFGSDDAFDRFLTTAANEAKMQANYNQIVGGPATARRVAGSADLAADDGLNIPAMAESALDFTNPVSAAGRLGKEALRRLPRRDRSILGDAELNGLLGQALSDEQAMTRLLNLMESQRGLLSAADRRVTGAGLLAVPGATSAGQERGRGLLTTNP